jgi:hypothetical protein
MDDIVITAAFEFRKYIFSINSGILRMSGFNFQCSQI